MVTAAFLRKGSRPDRDASRPRRALGDGQHDLAAARQHGHGILRADERVADGLSGLLVGRGGPVIEFAEFLRAALRRGCARGARRLCVSRRRASKQQRDSQYGKGSSACARDTAQE